MHSVCGSSWCYYCLIVFPPPLSAQLYFIGVVKVYPGVFSPMEIFLALHGATLWSKDQSTCLTVQYHATSHDWYAWLQWCTGEDEEADPVSRRSSSGSPYSRCVLRPHTNPWRKEEIIRARRSEECKYYFMKTTTHPRDAMRAPHTHRPRTNPTRAHLHKTLSTTKWLHLTSTAAGRTSPVAAGSSRIAQSFPRQASAP